MKLTLERAIAEADMRYGGDWHYQWDGYALLVNPAYMRLDPNQQLALADRLDLLLTWLPAASDGYDGWYYRAARA